MKKSSSGNYTIYESTDPCELHKYSETLAKELEKKDNEIEKSLKESADNINELEEENILNEENITEIIDLLPKVSNKGESITLENTARAKFTKFRIEGNSSQETRSGKNKIIFDDIKETVNQGITCSIKNGVITLNGTASGVVNFYSNPINISAGKYTLSKNMEGTWSLGTATSSLAILLQQKEKDGSYTTVKGGELTAYSSAKNFTTLDLAEGTYRIRVFIALGNILNNFTWRPQLEEGENFTGFEQGGLMPSEEFPSEIKNVKENVRINIRNKNFCDLDILEKLKEGAITINSSNSFTINLENGRMKITSRINIMLPDGIDKSKKYRIKYHRKMNNVSFLPRLSALYVDGSKEEVEDRVLEADYEYVTSGKELSGMTVSWNTQDQGGIVTFSNISITGINENSDFEESKKQTIIFPFKQGQILMQGDYLADDGIHHTKTQIQLDGVTNGLKVSNVTKHSNDIYYCVINLVKQSLNNTTDVSSMYCSHFMPHFEVKPGSCYIAGSGLYLVLVLTDQTITTVDAANTWLATQKEKGTPVVIEYKLAEEVVEPYTEVQKEAYEQIKNAISYKGQTNIFSTNEIKPIFEVEALADIGLLLNNIQAQILAGGE